MNISWILRRHTNYSRAEILELFNELQKRVYSQDCEQTMYLSSTTGMPPFLATTNDVYQYNCPSNCRRTFGIFAESVNGQSGDEYRGDYKRYTFGDTEYNLVPVKQTDASRGVLATVRFVSKYNPGTHADKYYHAYYLQPTELEDETEDELVVPEYLHFEMREGVHSMINAEDNGGAMEMFKILDEVARRIRNQLNGGTQARMFRTQLREEYRDFGLQSEMRYR